MVVNSYGISVDWSNLGDCEALITPNRFHLIFLPAYQPAHLLFESSLSLFAFT